MQLKEVVLYSKTGDRRRLPFALGALNVVSGESRTGKSALIGIVEYCLGRTTFGIPVGFRDAVGWYGVIVHFDDGSEAFVGRPSPRDKAASSSQAMLELGTDLEPPPASALRVNADTSTVRAELSSRLGITESPADIKGTQRPPLQPHVGHAAWLCLQSQNEVANNDLLFHRSGEREVATALQALLPYFLGAVTEDQAVLQHQLVTARRAARRLRRQIDEAQAEGKRLDADLHTMLAEARANGLTGIELGAPGLDAAGAVAALELARQAPAATLDGQPDAARGDEGLVLRRRELRRLLRANAERRELLDDSAAGEQGYLAAVGTEADRLRAAELVPAAADPDDQTCPLCSSELPEPDRRVSELTGRLARLRQDLGAAPETARRRAATAARLADAAEGLRAELAGVDAALAAGARQRGAPAGSAEQEAGSAREFTRGRIDFFLDRLSHRDGPATDELRAHLAAADDRVAALEEELDADDARDQLADRLAAVGLGISAIAQALGLEHADDRLRLDLKRLTVVAQTPSGPAPLATIGSGENWVGYHLAAHLALHRHFVTEGRPVPRFLVLDQPSQAYYAGDAPTEQFGRWRGDTDNGAVLRLLELVRDFVDSLGGRMQVIVTDHAWFSDDWFQEAVVEEWRDGAALVPRDWFPQPDAQQDDHPDEQDG